MTYIAKAMSKQTRLDAADERAEREAQARDEASAAPSDAPAASKRGSRDLEFVSGRPERPQDPRPLSPGPAAKTLAGMNSRARPEPPTLPPEMLGTLESPPPEAVPASRRSGRSWWREPVIIGGGALGIAALLIGFLVAPGGEPPISDAGSPAATAVQASGSPAAVAVNQEAADGEFREAAESESVATSSGRKPVVVRVQIDSGDGSSVEFESGETRAASAPRSAPKPPEIYEPLQPLELPPPPVADYTVEDPVPSSSGSRYASPPPGDSISDYRLEGIFWSEENPGVIINDEILDEGERLDQLKILKIHKDYVKVQLHGRTYDLR